MTVFLIYTNPSTYLVLKKLDKFWCATILVYILFDKQSYKQLKGENLNKLNPKAGGKTQTNSFPCEYQD